MTEQAEQEEQAELGPNRRRFCLKVTWGLVLNSVSMSGSQCTICDKMNPLEKMHNISKVSCPPRSCLKCRDSFIKLRREEYLEHRSAMKITIHSKTYGALQKELQ